MSSSSAMSATALGLANRYNIRQETDSKMMDLILIYFMIRVTNHDRRPIANGAGIRSNPGDERSVRLPMKPESSVEKLHLKWEMKI